MYVYSDAHQRKPDWPSQEPVPNAPTALSSALFSLKPHFPQLHCLSHVSACHSSSPTASSGPIQGKKWEPQGPHLGAAQEKATITARLP